MKQLSVFYKTEEHFVGFVLRLALATVMLPHGCQLLFGLFGGPGFTGSMNYFTQVEMLPWMVGFTVIILQFFGSLLILFGVMGRFFALSMIGLFIGMIITSHWQYGFFMNWLGSQKGEGIEFHVLAIGLSTALLMNGSGSYSFDVLLTNKLGDKRPYFDHVNV